MGPPEGRVTTSGHRNQSPGPADCQRWLSPSPAARSMWGHSPICLHLPAHTLVLTLVLTASPALVCAQGW